MTAEITPEETLCPGLLWGFDFVDGRAMPIKETDLLSSESRHGGFRWLHLNLSDQRTLRWLSRAELFGPGAVDLLLSPDKTQSVAGDRESTVLVLQDIELEFWESDPTIGALRIAFGPSILVTARRHPLRSAELVKLKLASGALAVDLGSALELVFHCMTDTLRTVINDLDSQVQTVEENLLRDRPAPDARAFVGMRSLMVRLHRMLTGTRSLLRRCEDEGLLPPEASAPAERFQGRLASLDAELLSIQSQLRLVRDELDLQAAQRTNQNLYFLSVMTAVFMPATLITGFFGMNTGGLPWASHNSGTFFASALVFGSSLLVYLVLRLSGFVRR